MSVFDSQWDQLSAQLDSLVDDALSDRLRYRVAGTWLGGVDQATATIPGYVIDEGGPAGIEAIDEILGNRKRVKVAKSLVAEISIDHRIQHPRLGPGTFRPVGALPETQGRYWVFDVEKAST